MNVIIDTQVLLWWLAGSRSLNAEASAIIADPQTTVFVSAVSVWEIWLKQSLGKLRLPGNFEQILAAQPFEKLPLSAAQARRVATLAWLHRDPFDRMLIAQALAEDLLLLTGDEVLRGYGAHLLVVA